jgi:hypothetical protein
LPQVLIPVTPEENQAITCTLPVNGGNVTLTLGLSFNTPGGYWWMSVADSTGNLLLDSVPLVGGSPPYDILAPYQYLQIGSAYVLPASSGLPDIPGFSTLGTAYTTPQTPSFFLVWSDNFGYVA